MNTKSLPIGNSKGFTLVELLISLVILSSVIVLASSAYSLYMSRWEGNFGRFTETSNNARNLTLLTKIITSTRPYIVRNQQSVPNYFFEGEPKSVLAISGASFADPDESALYKLEWLLKNGEWELQYSEVSTLHSWLNNPKSEGEWTTPIIIMTSITEPAISYFGWATQSDFSNSNREQRDWFEEYSAEVRKVMPEWLRITYGQQGEERMTITFPLLKWDPQYLARFRDDDGV